MSKKLLLIPFVILMIPIVHGIAQCKPASDIEITCKTQDCIYNLNEDITATLNVYVDNIGLESTQVKFYLHDVGQKDACLANPSSNCIQKQTTGLYISNGKSIVTFSKLSEYKEVEITAKMSKDDSTVTKQIFIRPAIQLTLFYPLEYSTGQYIVNQLAKLDVSIMDLVNKQKIINPDSFQCKFYKGTAEFTPDTKVCSPMEVSFTPESTGTYRIWAKATYTGKDQYGNSVPFFPSEYFIDLDVLLAKQKIETFIGGTNIRSMPKTGEGSIEVDTKSYTFQIKSSKNNEPFKLENCNLIMQSPDGSEQTLTLTESKCRSGIDSECIYTFSFDFLQGGDTYKLDGNCENNEQIIPFPANFVTLKSVVEPTIQWKYILIGSGIALLFIILVIILFKLRGRRPTSIQSTPLP